MDNNMSDKPEKIHMYPGSLIYSLKPNKHTVEYIRADPSKPTECDCCRQTTTADHYKVCQDCFKKDHQQKPEAPESATPSGQAEFALLAGIERHNKGQKFT